MKDRPLWESLWVLKSYLDDLQDGDIEDANEFLFEIKNPMFIHALRWAIQKLEETK